MAKSRIKPTFGKEMDPCVYSAKWANQLSKEDVIAIKAEPNRVKEVDER